MNISLVGILDYLGNIETLETMTIEEIVFTILIVFGLSIVILFTYRFSYQTTVYNKSFAISLPIIAMVTSVIIIAVSSNIILSLGMVGALSIVRFRTAIKNPFDTVFMFWAIGIGVTSGAGLNLVSAIATGIIMVAIFLLNALELLSTSHFLIIRADSNTDEVELLKQVIDIYGRYTIRNKTIKNNSLDLTLEVRSSSQDKSVLISNLKDIPGVNTVMLLSHQGDYISE